MPSTGPSNSITDAGGITIGNVEDEGLASGVTVVLCEEQFVCAAAVFGGGPGSREMDAVALEGSVGAADAIVISGGSAFGLDAATGVQSFLREKGRGFAIRSARVPIVPQAILFDLLNGGEKDWGMHPPYREMGYKAAAGASARFDFGAAGAGSGATVAGPQSKPMRGGLGSASEIVPAARGATAQGVTVGALAAVNAVGSVTAGDTRHFWAAPFEQGSEFGGHGSPNPWPVFEPRLKFRAAEGGNTTLCVVATDAALTQAQCKRVAIMAAAGMGRAINPVFTPFDGDIVFVLATGRIAVEDPSTALPFIGAAAANCVARAIARGVYEAKGTLPDGTRSYRDIFG